MFFHLTRRVDAAPEDAASGAGFSEHESRVLLAEITLGLEHMHAHNFIHCDIKVRGLHRPCLPPLIFIFDTCLLHSSCQSRLFL